MLELGNSTIEGHLATLKTWTNRTARTGLLTSHTKTTTGTLASSYAPTLAQFAAAGTWLGLESV
jgi:hypothetical protein